MSQCVRHKDKNTRIITQIGEKEYLIEAKSSWAKFGCQFDPSVITSAKLESGPYLIVNDSFLGEGKIASIQNIDSGQEDHIILKITLY
jgi:hypothetical protein